MFNQKFSQNQLFMVLLSAAFWWVVMGSLVMAIGLLALIFVHEMGHVVAARYKGLEVSMPTFTPLGGQVLTQGTRTAAEEAFVKMAGPLVGGLAALFALLVGSLFGSDTLIKIAIMGFAVNLFNLIPLDPFDGGGITQAVSKWFWIPGVICAGYLLTLIWSNPINLIIAAIFFYQAYQAFLARREEHEKRFWYFNTSGSDKVTILVLYGILVLAFIWLLADANSLVSCFSR